MSILRKGSAGLLVTVVAAACGGGMQPPNDGPSDMSGTGAEAGAEGSGATSGDGGSAGAGTGGKDASGAASSGDGGRSSTGGGGGSSTLACTLRWSSGFEAGFPSGEWQPWDNGSWSPDGSMPPGRVNAWTIVDRSDGEPIFSGDHAYKGWIEGPDTESHRAYPVIHTDMETPLVNTFMVYLDVDYEELQNEWIHFGTWGNEEGDTGSWALNTMSVRFRKLEFAHVTPSGGQYIGSGPQPDFPTGKWVRFTVYLHYQGTTGFVQAWQDGVPMLRGEVSDLAEDPGTRLTRAHWGMYASTATSSGTQYNDDISIWSLTEPLSDLVSEPDCYLGK